MIDPELQELYLKFQGANPEFVIADGQGNRVAVEDILDKIVQTLSVKDFLGFSLGGYEDPRLGFSVADLIKAYAHQFGGVHVERPPEAASMIHQWIGLDEVGARQALASLGRITHRALFPLAQLLEWQANGSLPAQFS